MLAKRRRVDPRHGLRIEIPTLLTVLMLIRMEHSPTEDDLVLDGQLAVVVAKQGESGVKYVTPVPPDEADGLLAETYEQLDDEYLVAPPFTLHSPIPALFAGLWSIYASYRVEQGGTTERVVTKRRFTATMGQVRDIF